MRAERRPGYVDLNKTLVRGFHMFRFALSVLALSVALATVQPAFADSASANTVEHSQAATAEQQPVVMPAAGVSIERSAAPAGFGWG